MPKMDGYENGVPCWVDLAATDVDAAKEFYSGLFGWQWKGGKTPQGKTYWGASIGGAAVAGCMALPTEMEAQRSPSAWNTYIAVDDVDATTAKGEKAGATILVAPVDVPGAGRMAFVLDPAGAAIGMWQGVEHKGAGLVKEHGSLVWSELYAADTEATVAFYTEIFGWEAQQQGDVGPWKGYTTFALGGQPVAGTMPPPKEGVPPHWHVWFASDDPDETAARAAEFGATALVDPKDTPMGKIASFLDPVGAAFSVIAPSMPS